MDTTAILIVDDDLKILDEFQQGLTGLEESWDIFIARNGLEALPILQNEEIDVLVTDLRMPGMDGAELLAKVTKLYPHLIRFVHSTTEERSLIYRSIGAAHQFLTKPCTPAVMHTAIADAVDLRNKLDDPQLQQLVSRIGVLPNVQHQYLEVVRAIEDPDVAVSDVGRIIGHDVGMSAKMLQLVNSAFFGLGQRISSPEHAAVLLGLDIIKSLVLWFNLASQFHQIRVPDFALGEYQLHSQAVGTFAQAIAKREGFPRDIVDDMFKAGMFHDMGKLILAGNLPREYAQVLDEVKSGANLETAELRVLGATHAQIGAYLLALWGFPNTVVEACWLHHHPEEYTGTTLGPAPVVYLANLLEHEFRAREGKTSPPVIDEALLDRLNLHERLPLWRRFCEELYDLQKPKRMI